MCFWRWFEVLEVTAKEVSLTVPNTKLTSMPNTDNGLYYIDLQHLEPAVIAVVHHDTTGLKADLCSYCMMSDLVERVWALFEHGDC